MPKRKPDAHGDRDMPAGETIRVRGRVYEKLEDIGQEDGRRYWVRDRRAGPRGDFRQILVLPKARTSRRHLAVLQRLSQGNPNLPTILDYEQRPDEILDPADGRMREHQIVTHSGGDDAGHQGQVQIGV